MGVIGRAVYDFAGDTSQGELVFMAGDVIDIINQDIGEGWWEGSVNGGNRGLLPASYVELTGGTSDHDMPAAPPPMPGVNVTSDTPDDGEGEMSSEDDDDVWDDPSDDEDSLPGPSGGGGGGLHPGHAAAGGPVQHRGHSNASDFGRAQSIKKSKGLRASAFVKAGAEDYMIGNQQVHVQDSDQVAVEDTNGFGPGWVRDRDANQNSAYVLLILIVIIPSLFSLSRPGLPRTLAMVAVS